MSFFSTLGNANSGLGSTAPMGANATTQELPNGPSDSISHVEWSSETVPYFLSCGSWDGTARIWHVQQGLGSLSYVGEVRMVYQNTYPVLTTAFSEDSTKYFVAGCSNEIKVYDLGLGNTNGQVIGKHDQPVSKLCWNPVHNVVVSASWDGYIKMWDGKSPNPIWQYNAGGKIYAMDLRGFYLGAADSNRYLYMWDLKRLNSSPTKMNSALKLQSRSLGLFIDPDTQAGWGLGGIEGRCSIAYASEPRPSRKNFCFKCHRQQLEGNTRIHAINAIQFLKDSPIFITAGSDGFVCTWDKDARQKLKSIDGFPIPISDAKWNRSGSGLVAFSVSYDWHKGPDAEAMKQGSSVRVVMLSQDYMRSGQKGRTAATRR